MTEGYQVNVMQFKICITFLLPGFSGSKA